MPPSSPAPALRGATYASLTRNIVAMSRKGGPSKREKTPPGGGEGSGAEDSKRVVEASFRAWAERTEGRLRHRDAKAERHHRLGQLRRAMAAWEAHRAAALGVSMAEAFAGRFGLTSRFFVRFAFDALRAHARGGRLAARNRAAMERLVSLTDPFGKARLRQAWRRWAPPRPGQELCREASEPEEPPPASEPAHPTPQRTRGSFAALTGKLKAVGSFTNPGSAAPAPKSFKSAAASSFQGAAQRQERSASSAYKASTSKEEESWAEWLGNEASISVVSPDGERDSLGAAPQSSGEVGRAVAKTGRTLSPTRSFRGVGAALKSIKSFRDGRDKSQVRRQRGVASLQAS